MQLKVPGSEPPSRVTLGAWPNPGLDRGRRCKAAQTLWEVPVESMKARDLSDSCVVIYWDEREVAAGASRVVLGEAGSLVEAGDDEGELGMRHFACCARKRSHNPRSM